jgi:hypothetical protein
MATPHPDSSPDFRAGYDRGYDDGFVDGANDTAPGLADAARPALERLETLYGDRLQTATWDSLKGEVDALRGALVEYDRRAAADQ